MSDTIEKPSVDTDADIATAVEPYEDSNDPNRRTHIINPPHNTHIWRPGMSSQDVVDLARSQGLEVRSLCGHVWIPKHNPDKYEACETCVEIAMNIIREMG